MPGKPAKKPVSKAQAKFFGAVAGGVAKEHAFSSSEARKKLKGVKYEDLPESAMKKKFKKK